MALKMLLEQWNALFLTENLRSSFCQTPETAWTTGEHTLSHLDGSAHFIVLVQVIEFIVKRSLLLIQIVASHCAKGTNAYYLDHC